jgi:hypothetical protein
LKLCVPTRWSSHFISVENLLNAKYALLEVVGDVELMEQAKGKKPEKVAAFMEKINSSELWLNAKTIRDILFYPTNLINVFERDNCDLSKVYPRFQKLKQQFQNDSFLNGVVRRRWDFINTESMSIAYLFSPRGAAEKWFGYDYNQAKRSFQDRIKYYYDEEDEVKQCEVEMNNFLLKMNDVNCWYTDDYKAMDVKSYWAEYGRKTYPILAKIVTNLYLILTSSAAAERVWSIFTFIHTKKRNRLAMDKVDKLVYISVNSALLDTLDLANYFEDLELDSDDEGTTEIINLD